MTWEELQAHIETMDVDQKKRKEMQSCTYCGEF